MNPHTHLPRVLSLLLITLTILPGLSTAAGLSDDDLAELPHFSDEILTRWKVPGAAVVVVLRDKVLFSGGFGHRSSEAKDRVDASTIFAIGSATKAFTATAIGSLVDQNLINLDRPVRTYLPTFSLHSAYATLHATPRDLLTHRVGLPRHDPVWYRSERTRAEIFSSLRHLEPLAELRERFIYNNLMYLVAGQLVETIGGDTWENYVDQNIFTPLSMAHSSFGHLSGDNVALAHALDSEGRVTRIPPYEGWAAGPASSISSTADDIATWLQFNLGRTFDVPIVHPETLREIHSPHSVVPTAATPAFPITTYGLGWFIGTYRGRLLLWHTGSIDGYTSWVGFLPHDNVGVAILTNLSSNRAPEVISRWVFDRTLDLEEIDWHSYLVEQEALLLAAKKATRELALQQGDSSVRPSVPLERYAGLYQHPAYGEITIEVGAEGLEGLFHGIAGRLRHFTGDHFIFEVTGDVFEDMFELTFHLTGDGSVTSLSTPLEKGIRPILFRHLPTQVRLESK